MDDGEGTNRVESASPAVRAAIKPTKDEEVCAKDKDFKTEDWVISPKGGIKNVVVWLAPEPDAAWAAAIKAGKKKTCRRSTRKTSTRTWPKPASGTRRDRPAVLPVHPTSFRPGPEGQKMVIKNSAPVPHNAKWTSKNNDEFNPLIPAGAQFNVPTPLVAERYPIKIECSIHPWMKAYVWVFNHPYFAVTDDEGNFEIKDAPVLDGKLRLVAWHESGGLTDDWRLGRADRRQSGHDRPEGHVSSRSSRSDRGARKHDEPGHIAGLVLLSGCNSPQLAPASA